MYIEKIVRLNELWKIHATLNIGVDFLLILSHLFELLGPGLLGFLEAFLCLFGFLETPHHLLVEGVFLPVFDLLSVLVEQAILHLLVQLTNLVCLRHDTQPGSLYSTVLRSWYHHTTQDASQSVHDRTSSAQFHIGSWVISVKWIKTLPSINK